MNRRSKMAILKTIMMTEKKKNCMKLRRKGTLGKLIGVSLIWATSGMEQVFFYRSSISALIGNSMKNDLIRNGSMMVIIETYNNNKSWAIVPPIFKALTLSINKSELTRMNSSQP